MPTVRRVPMQCELIPPEMMWHWASRELAEAHAAVDCLRRETAAAAETDAAHAAHVERMGQELARCAAGP